MEKNLNITFPVCGKIRLRTLDEIGTTGWMLGCETLDRDFADYDQYKDYIAPLGIKTIRLQGGWAKTEKVQGVYDFAWLDHIIDDARSRGLDVLLETDYGNPIYPGGGGFDLAGGFPRSEEALTAWDSWVRAMAVHFRGRVRDWAMWNEPDINGEHTSRDIALFNIRTAEIILSEIPDARIAGLSLASSSPYALENCLAVIAEEKKESLFTWFIYHGYTYNPDVSYGDVLGMKMQLMRYGMDIRLRQGENGCPSEEAHRFALSNHPWTEFSQCKWDLRRYLGDFGHGVDSAVFTICDFNHKGREINRKGLLYADENHTVIRKKRVYSAIQNMVSVFDSSMKLLPGSGVAVLADRETYAFRAERNGALLAAYWLTDCIPGEMTEPETAELVIRGTIREPVLCELISGTGYAVPESAVHCSDGKTIIGGLPLADSPLVVAEKSALPL